MFGKGESGLLSSFGAEADAGRGGAAAGREAEFEGGFYEGAIVGVHIASYCSQHLTELWHYRYYSSIVVGCVPDTYV